MSNLESVESALNCTPGGEGSRLQGQTGHPKPSHRSALGGGVTAASGSRALQSCPVSCARLAPLKHHHASILRRSTKPI